MGLLSTEDAASRRLIFLDAYYADAIPSRLTPGHFSGLKRSLTLTDHYAPVEGLRHFSTW